jgi:hypothetical protein
MIGFFRIIRVTAKEVVISWIVDVSFSISLWQFYVFGSWYRYRSLMFNEGGSIMWCGGGCVTISRSAERPINMSSDMSSQAT